MSMLEYSLAHWMGFLAAAIALEIVPGPDYLFIAAQTARHGRGHGFWAMLGVWTGALMHIAATVLGLSALLVHFAPAFTLIKWVGAAYLIWLGIQTLTAAPAGVASSAPAVARPSRWRAYRQGVLIDLLNPKVALFFLAFVPQFVVPGAGSMAAQLALHGVMLIVVAAVFEPAFILLGDRVARYVRGRQRLARGANRAVGAIFIALGARLAFIYRY